MTCYELVKQFKRNYPGTIAWRLLENAKVIDEHVNPDETVLYAFAGQKNESPFDFFQTAVVALTDKRLLIGQKRVLFGSAFSSITPDLYNDMQVYEGIIWGKVIIDTVKEELVISNLSKSSLVEIETKISQFMIEEKRKYVHVEEEH